MILRHLLHLLSDQLLLIKHLGLHLCDLLVFGDQLFIFDVELFLQSCDAFLELSDLTNMISVVSLSLGSLGWRRI